MRWYVLICYTKIFVENTCKYLTTRSLMIIKRLVCHLFYLWKCNFYVLFTFVVVIINILYSYGIENILNQKTSDSIRIWSIDRCVLVSLMLLIWDENEKQQCMKPFFGEYFRLQQNPNLSSIMIYTKRRFSWVIV